MLHRFCVIITLQLALLASGPLSAAERFYRIIDGPNPGPAAARIDRFTYGTDVLYTGDAHRLPTRVEGTVWHSNLEEAKYFVGTRNPVIEQGELYKRIENDKWEESKILMQYVPEAYPRTESMADLLSRLAPGSDPGQRLGALAQALRERYPDGFFLKPVAGFNAAGTFPTEKSDFASIYAAYLRDVKPVIERRLRETRGDATAVHLELKDLPNYSGRVLDDLMSHPETVIVQAKIKGAVGSVLQTRGGPKPLLAEYRVHVVEGQVLPEATQTRWEDARSVSKEAFAEVERFTQGVIDRLPAPMRKMCFGMDVMRTQDGGYQVIELNPGGESGYLYPDTDLWVTQLLAARYNGGHTPLLDEFERFSREPTQDAKEAALEKLLGRKELKGLVSEVSPVSELLARAKDVMLADLKRLPTRQNALDALGSLKRFHLEPYLTSPEIETLAGLVRDPQLLEGGGLAEVGGTLALKPGEILFVGTEGEIRLLNGLAYDDRAVAERLAARVREGLDHAPTRAEARELVRSAADRGIVTRAELSSGRVVEDAILKELPAGEAQGLLFYSGTRLSLLRAAMKVLFEGR